VTVTSTRSNASAPILANIEAAWKNLPAEEQYEVYQQLEELQKKDWKELTVDEKKAGEWALLRFGRKRREQDEASGSWWYLNGSCAAR
jgi:hypothetical protein